MEGSESGVGKCGRSPGKTRPFRLAGVVFDFDGTLTRPGHLDFDAIRELVGCPRGEGLLEYLGGIKDPEERRRKEAILEGAESVAAERGVPNEGAEELVAFLRSQGVPMAIITRNRRGPVEKSLKGFKGIDLTDFAALITRDFFLDAKPSPDGVLHIAQQLGVEARDLLLIGDHAFDVEAGRNAGALTMFLCNEPRDAPPEESADFTVSSLKEATSIIRYGLPLPMGKLPANLLQEALDGQIVTDPTVLVKARVGEDAAVMTTSGTDALVVSSDPITLAADLQARYAVLVNANDVATSGATPRWFLATMLFPPGSTPSEILALIGDIQGECAAHGISLCGGHTEITDAVVRPVVVGTMIGTVSAERLIDKSRMTRGDRILMTKRVAVEGTGLIAREFAPRLAAAGLTVGEIEESAALLERIGILAEARIAGSFPGVTALHDVTEGGIAAAVGELAAAGGCRLRVCLEKIPLYPQTQRICAAMDLDPLGLIGSGSLLIACRPDTSDELAETIKAEGIEVTEIGEVLGRGQGIEALRGDARVEWPSFDRDEVTRLTR